MSMTRNALISAMTVGALALGALAQPAATPASKEAPKHATKDAAQPKEKSTKSATAKIGETAPDFTLTDTDGKSHTLSSLKGKIVVLEWFNPECPVIKETHQNRNFFNPMVDSYAGKEVVFLGVNTGKSADKDATAAAVKTFGMKYPVLLDSDSKVGKMYGAKTTPHVFVIAADGTLAYMGAIDNGSPSKAGTTNYVKQAIDELNAGKKISTPETKPYGCGVKF
jgi:peroxiredoxin